MNAIDAALAKPDNTAFAIAIGDDCLLRDCLEREVNDGGFDQFFVNFSGDTSLETITALERLGARHTAELVRRAIAVFPTGHPSPDRDARLDQMEGIRGTAEELRDNLDTAFYEYRDDLAQL